MTDLARDSAAPDPADLAGAETLEIMSAAPRYNAWQFACVAPFIGRRILEVGSGIGNMSAHFAARKPEHLVLTDTDSWYRDRLAEKFGQMPGVRVASLTLPDPDAADTFAVDRLDTAVALNVVEHIPDDVGTLRTMRDIVTKDGRVVILVPALEGLFGSLDRALDHQRRYTPASLRRLFNEAGLRLVHLSWFNRVGALGWWFNARVRRRERIPLGQLRMFDALVPVLRWERWLPLPFGQSLIAVGVRDAV